MNLSKEFYEVEGSQNNTTTSTFGRHIGRDGDRGPSARVRPLQTVELCCCRAVKSGRQDTIHVV